MKLIIGSDDPGEVFDLARAHLQGKDFDVVAIEHGPWPDVALAVAEAVASGDADQGILMCWTGTGTAMMANKVKGARAALAWEPWIATGARRYNDANILVLSLKRTPVDLVAQILDAWFAVDGPDADEVANIKKITDYEGGPNV